MLSARSGFSYGHQCHVRLKPFATPLIPAMVKRSTHQWYKNMPAWRGNTSELPYISKLMTYAKDGRINRIGRMFSVQTKLPHLPIPPLQQTLMKYLQTVKPIVSSNEYEKTKKIVEKFGSSGGTGEKLQDLLQKKASSLTNWYIFQLSDWWLNTAYLGNRLPVVIHCSPGLIFPAQPVESSEQQIRLAARLLAGMLQYKQKIDRKELEVEMLGKEPLCMDQYYKIFSSCRIPGVKDDQVVCYPPYQHNISHVIVMCRGHIWYMDIYDSSHNPLPELDMCRSLEHIFSTSTSTPPAPLLGIMTSENRNVWGKVHKKLESVPSNRSHFKDIESAILVLCLDKSPKSFEVSSSRTRAAHLMLHGCGSQYNSNNRWFDKTIQMIVDDGGSAGVCYEHSPAEGPPIASLMDYILDYSYNQGELSSGHIEKGAIVGRVERLEFDLSGIDLEVTNTAQQRLDVLINDLDLTCFAYEEYGKTFVKSHKLSPDSYIQVAFQLAYYRMYGELPATYESASTRRFQLGRTDTIRSQSMAALTFCKSMESGSVSDRRSALRDAVSTHKSYVTEAINGQAVDRHLLGLKLIAVENGLNVPEVHMDTSYLATTHYKLSTSQVPSKHEVLLSFGPVAEDGYGLCYNPMKEKLLLGVSAWRRYKGTDTTSFTKSLSHAFTDMKQVLDGVSAAKL